MVFAILSAARKTAYWLRQTASQAGAGTPSVVPPPRYLLVVLQRAAAHQGRGTTSQGSVARAGPHGEFHFPALRSVVR